MYPKIGWLTNEPNKKCQTPSNSIQKWVAYVLESSMKALKSNKENTSLSIIYPMIKLTKK